MTLVSAPSNEHWLWTFLNGDLFKCRGAAAAVIVFDITNTESLGKAKTWVKELQRQGNPNMIMALAGNKADLGDARAVTSEEAQVVTLRCFLDMLATHPCSAVGTGKGHIAAATCRREGRGQQNELVVQRCICQAVPWQQRHSLDSISMWSLLCHLQLMPLFSPQSFAEENGLFFWETSAKTNVNVVELFNDIAQKLPRAAAQPPPSNTGITLSEPPQQRPQKSGCC